MHSLAPLFNSDRVSFKKTIKWLSTNNYDMWYGHGCRTPTWNRVSDKADI